VLTSIKPNNEIYAVGQGILPQAPTLEHFTKVVSKGAQLPRYVFNTLIYSAVTIAAVTMFGSMAGYALGTLKFRGSQFAVNMILLLLSVPWVILLVPLLMFEFRLYISGNNATGPGDSAAYCVFYVFLPMAKVWIMRARYRECRVNWVRRTH
jgi:ABC-type glycerol-3-phosphate transport system permease component